MFIEWRRFGEMKNNIFCKNCKYFYFKGYYEAPSDIWCDKNPVYETIKNYYIETTDCIYAIPSQKNKNNNCKDFKQLNMMNKIINWLRIII